MHVRVVAISHYVSITRARYLQIYLSVMCLLQISDTHMCTESPIYPSLLECLGAFRYPVQFCEGSWVWVYWCIRCESAALVLQRAWRCAISRRILEELFCGDMERY
jgi:hypothetical protein